METSSRRLRALDLVGTASAAALGAVLLKRTSQRALRPVEEEREAEQREREARARRIIDTAGAAFLAFDSMGTVVDWNAQAERMFAWSGEEILGKPVSRLFAPESGQALLGAAEEARPGDDGVVLGHGMVLSARRSDGHAFTVEATAWVTTERQGIRVNAFLTDVTERRRSEQAARRLAAIVESSDDAIIGKDCDGTVLTWNQGAERIHGYTADEMVGKPIYLLVPPERHGEIRGLLDTVRGGKAIRYHETVRVTKYGELVDVALTMSPVRDETGEVVGASTIARDITEQRWMAKTLDTTLGALEAALEEAREAEARSRRFLADAAHQLRSPVAGIRACAETLLRGPPPEERDRLLATMIRETSRSARLVSSLLQVARLDQGEPLSPVPTDLVALCEDEADRSRSLVLGVEVVMRVENHPDHKPEIDPNAVREILSNLLDNARRHAERSVEIEVGFADGTAEVRVHNDGPPLPDELAERVFERFVSVGGHKGSGLGLPIGRGLARAHGGDLTYEQGCFVLRLPLRPPGTSATYDG